METEIQTMIQLVKVINGLQIRAMDALPESGRKMTYTLTTRQHKAMMSVYMRSLCGLEPFTIGELGEELWMKKAAISTLVAALEKKKLLIRTTDKQNRRFTRVSLSASGQRFGNAAFEQGRKIMFSVLSVLTKQEKRSFAEIAGKLYRSAMQKAEGGK